MTRVSMFAKNCNLKKKCFKQQKMIRKWEKNEINFISETFASERYKTSFIWNDKKELEVEDCRR